MCTLVDRFQQRIEWAGKTYDVCGAGCRGRFDAEPEQYLDPSRPREHAHH